MILGSGLIQAANTFVGAYDAIPSIAAAYSTRRLLSSYTGPLLRLVADRTGYPEQDIGATAAGDLDTAAAASFLAGDSGYITKWYDQSGNTKDAAQATLANMPLYVASGQNSRPVVRYAGTSDNFEISAEITVGSACVLASYSGGATFPNYSGIFSGHATTNNRYFFIGTVGASSLYTGTGATFVSEIWINGTKSVDFSPLSSMKILSGIDSTPTSGTGHVIGSDRLIATRWWAGDIPELIVASAAWGTSDRQAAESAANAYWSVY